MIENDTILPYLNNDQSCLYQEIKKKIFSSCFLNHFEKIYLKLTIIFSIISLYFIYLLKVDIITAIPLVILCYFVLVPLYIVIISEIIFMIKSGKLCLNKWFINFHDGLYYEVSDH